MTSATARRSASICVSWSALMGSVLDLDGGLRALLDRTGDAGSKGFVGLVLQNRDDIVVVVESEDLWTRGDTHAMSIATQLVDDDLHLGVLRCLPNITF